MQDFWREQGGKLLQAGALLLSPSSIFSLPELAVSLAIALAFLAWRQKRRRGRVRPGVIWRATMRAAGRLHFGSVRADMFYFFVNSFAISGLIGWALVSSNAITVHVAHGFAVLFGKRHAAALPAWALRGALTLLTFLAYEFAYYCDHYAKHKIPFLWAFHQTHHSAESLTPLTVFRVHPVDTLIFLNIIALLTGLAYGGFFWAAGQEMNPYAIGAANVLTVLFLFLLAQLQHSQFWIPLRGVAGRLVLSPAHHQLHHSLDPAHHDCNLGSCLAVFDWVFGTLYIPPEAPPRLAFGVTQPAAEPHRIFTLLLSPFGNALSVLRGRRL